MSWRDVELAVDQAKRELGEDGNTLAIIERAQELTTYASRLLWDADELRNEVCRLKYEVREAYALLSQKPVPMPKSVPDTPAHSEKDEKA